jgi:hypothetical protein
VGGVPGQGVVAEGVKGVKHTPLPPEIYKNGEKTGGFPHFLAYKLPKMPFFTQKYLTRYPPKTFLRNESILNFALLKPLWSYTCSHFWKSYTCPAAQVRVNFVPFV